ncbi:DUF3892 domain-containing protein [Ideonella oryzae]|uniref:DUF3892 domain-containing protein n=1 Tax=Ideonella oryzae TaxID=2937441 RepID=A0ABT1BPG1_9BURK|nr:DUF3892 domain-containing protein [Ideonella oryzae]
MSYNSDNTHIQNLMVHNVDVNGKFNSNNPIKMSRHQVVDKIKAGSKFTTIIQKIDKTWILGAEIEIISVETEYLKTKSDTLTRDNLENLPTF